MKEGVVIVGAGHAGVSLAATLRSLNYDGNIALLSDEADFPYHRPPLSKAFMSGDPAEAEKRVRLQAEAFYDEKRIDLHLATRVAAIDVAGHRLRLESGGSLAYRHLVLATGARARALPLPGADLAGIETLRTLDDARRIRSRLQVCQSVLVVGGGFIGLEIAATARQLGKEVRVLETAARIMERSVSPVVSEFVTRRHRDRGIGIELNARVLGFVGEEGRVTGVRGESGSWYADLVIVGAGAVPNSELAEAAGIHCANGVVVDARMRSSAPDVFAIGDCAAHENVHAQDARIRLESIQNANDQARVVAQQLTGSGADYNALPWFWSDQGDVKLQMVGLAHGRTDSVTRGDPAQGRFSVFHYRDRQLISVDSINQPLEHMLSRKLLAAGVSPDKALLADPGLDLKSLLP